MNRIKIMIYTFFLSMFFTTNIFAVNYDDAPVVQLLKSCTNSNGGVIDNCFEESGDLTNWMKNTRKPNVSAPLKVNIGSGTFDGFSGGGNLKLICNPADSYTGYTHFEGAGALQTIMNPASPPVGAKDCTDLEFSKFKIVTGYHYMFWRGGGKSRWSDMEIETSGGSWTESLCAAERGQHYWYSSKLSFGTGGGTGYTAICDESWFYGSEISLNDSILPLSNNGHALKAEGVGEIHVYGGNISAINFPGLTGNSNAMIKAMNGGKIHIHGTGIDLKPVANAADNMSIFYADTGSTIHANSNAYAVQFSVGNASISRITEDGGNIVAPYNWGALLDPPMVAGSKTGSDIVIETDCSATCDNSGALPHTLVYDSSCSVFPGGAWRDTATSLCRGQ